MKKTRFIITLSILLNIMLIFFIVQIKFFATAVPLEKEETTINQTSISDKSKMETRKSPVQLYNKMSLADDFENRLKENQMFYGTWEIVDMVAPDAALPSRYSGFDKNGDFRGPDYEEFLGENITFQKDFLEYKNTKYEYAYKPVTYSYPLPDPDNKIGYYNVDTLGLKGNYYSTVYYFLPNNYKVNSNFQEPDNKLYISDFYTLYIKDKDTMYMSQGVLDFLLQRVK